MSQGTENEIKIMAELVADPSSCKFVVDRPVLDEWTLIFRGADESQGSELIDRLFEIEGISRIRVGGNQVTVTKDAPTEWPELARQIGQAIRMAIQSGNPLISKAALDAVRAAPTDDIVALIEELFETQINPAIASHGGFVRLVKVEDHDVFLEMGGGCQGCSASKATLRDGIETAIRQVAPHVRHVIDMTDHASGTNPYYA